MATQKNGTIFPITANYRATDFDLSSVTPESVKQILRWSSTGRVEEPDRLYRLMLDTWPRLRKCRNEVAGAVKRLPLEVHPYLAPGETQPSTEAIAMREVVVRSMDSYAPRPGHWELDLCGMVDALVDAYIIGIRVLEIAWQQEGGLVSPRAYVPVPGMYLAFPYRTDMEDRLMLAIDGAYRSLELQDFPPDRFIVGIWQLGGAHPMYAANARALAKHWLGYSYGHGWLMQYAQLFGIPWRVAKTDGTKEAMDAASTAMDDVGANGYAILGPGTDFEIANGVSGTASEMPQSHLMDSADKACDILLLGQTLTTDNQGSGSRALGDVHADVRQDVLEGVAKWVEGIITTQLIPAIVRWNYGPNVSTSTMPYCTLTVPESKDMKATAEALKTVTVDIGAKVGAEWAYDALGIPMPKEGEAVIGDDTEEPEPPDDEAAIEDDDEALEMEAARTDGPDLRPTEEMASNARRALEIRKKAAPSNRGMTRTGLARARQLINRENLSPLTVRRMKAFFDRHQGTKPDGEVEGSPWQQAWLGWGGDAGRAWAERKVKELDA